MVLKSPFAQAMRKDENSCTRICNYVQLPLGINFMWISEDCNVPISKRYEVLSFSKVLERPFGILREYLYAVSKCLDALGETGIDEDSRELRGLWIESFDAEGDSDGVSDRAIDSDHEEQTNPSPQLTAVAKEPLK